MDTYEKENEKEGIFYQEKEALYSYLSANIINFIKEFYSIIALDSITHPTPFKHSHEKWNKDFNEYKTLFFGIFSHMIYDYTVESVFSELRHSNYSNFYIKGLNPDMYRTRSFFESYKFTSDSILKLGAKMFDPNFNFWQCGYGGKPWHDISKAGLMYKKVPDIIFIDHCIDLQHNAGSYFDKGGFIFRLEDRNLRNFLDLKRTTKNPLCILVEAQSYKMQNLILRARNLNIFDNVELPDDFIERLKIGRIFYDIRDSFSTYCNHFYYDRDKKATGYKDWTLDSLYLLYHPII